LLHALRPTADFVYSVSCTTRAPRTGEIEGEDYFFLTREEFERRIAAGDFLEYAEVHGNLYGTLCVRVLDQLEAGIDVLIDIDTQGAANIRRVEDIFDCQRGNAGGQRHPIANQCRFGGLGNQKTREGDDVSQGIAHDARADCIAKP